MHMDTRISSESNFSIYSQKILRGVANALSVQFSIDEQPTNYVEGSKVLRIREDIKIFLGLIYRADAILSENAHFFLHELRNLIASSKK